MTSRKGKETTVAEREIVINLHRQGKSLREISEIVTRSKSTIQYIIKRHKKCNTTQNKSRSGRPAKLNTRERRAILTLIRKNPRISASQIVDELKRAFGKTVHKITVCRAIKKGGYRSRVTRRKPFVSEVNRRKRVQFAQKYINESPEFWEKVIFTDESKFSIFKTSGRILVWRKPGKAYDPKNLQSTVKHGGGGIMVWGCMASAGVGRLQFITETMDRFGYIQILQNNLKPSVEQLDLPRDYYFQQDNDPKHTSRIAREWIIWNTPHTLNTPP